MTTLLRQIATGRYYECSGKWTFDPDRAHDFGSVTRALNFVRKAGLSDIELDLSFDRPEEAAGIRFRDLVRGAC